MSTNISADLSDETLKRLERLALQSGMTLDELIQLAIDRWLANLAQDPMSEEQHHCKKDRSK